LESSVDCDRVAWAGGDGCVACSLAVAFDSSSVPSSFPCLVLLLVASSLACSSTACSLVHGVLAHTSHTVHELTIHINGRRGGETLIVQSVRFQ